MMYQEPSVENKGSKKIENLSTQKQFEHSKKKQTVDEKNLSCCKDEHCCNVELIIY